MENEILEYKKSLSELDDAMKSISGMLNKRNYGVILFGVNNDGTINKQLEITDKTMRNISQKIDVSIEPKIYPKIEKKLIDKKEIIEVSFSGQKTPYSADGKYYIRVADSNRLISRDELKRFFLKKDNEFWEDEETEYTLNDLDEETWSNFINNLRSTKRIQNLEFKKIPLLKKLNLIKNNHLTNACFYLFSNKQPLIYKLGVFSGIKKNEIINDDTCFGNIFQLINRGIDFLKKNLNWKYEINDNNIKRKETLEIPFVALREAIVNSFAHASYYQRVNHEIDIFNDRVVITNPGSFAAEESFQEMLNNDVSCPRNKRITYILFLAGYVESFGTGIQKIKETCKDKNIIFKSNEQENYFQIIFERPNYLNINSNLINYQSNKEEIENSKNKQLNKTQKEILEILRNNPNISKNDIAIKLDCNIRTVNRNIKTLKELKLIK